MKREYELEQKAGEIAQVAIIESSAIGVPNDHIEPWVKDFAIGVAVATAKWADSSPAWVSVEERLPEHNEEENGLISYSPVLVCLYDGYRTEDYYDDTRGKWGDYDGEVEYWMPLPTLPVKKGGKE